MLEPASVLISVFHIKAENLTEFTRPLFSGLFCFCGAPLPNCDKYMSIK